MLSNVLIEIKVFWGEHNSFSPPILWKFWKKLEKFAAAVIYIICFGNIYRQADTSCKASSQRVLIQNFFLIMRILRFIMMHWCEQSWAQLKWGIPHLTTSQDMRFKQKIFLTVNDPFISPSSLPPPKQSRENIKRMGLCRRIAQVAAARNQLVVFSKGSAQASRLPCYVFCICICICICICSTCWAINYAQALPIQKFIQHLVIVKRSSKWEMRNDSGRTGDVVSIAKDTTYLYSH